MNHSLKQVRINNFNIEYVDTDNFQKPILFFAHGLGGNLRQWDQQIDYFASHYRVIALSLQGHGSSSKSDNPNDYTIFSYAKVCISLLDYLNVTSCIWIGNSMGGVVAYEVISIKPELISHLITNGTAPKIIYTQWLLKTINIADKVLIKGLGFQRYINIAVNASLKNPDIRKKLASIFMSASPLTILCSHQCLGRYDYIELIKGMSQTLTIIRTPHDKDINKLLDKEVHLLKTLDHVTIKNQVQGGHIYNMELPSHYNECLEKILISKKL